MDGADVRTRVCQADIYLEVLHTTKEVGRVEIPACRASISCPLAQKRILGDFPVEETEGKEQTGKKRKGSRPSNMYNRPNENTEIMIKWMDNC